MAPFAEIAHEAKLEVARTMFAQEFERLRALYRTTRLEEAAAALHVYRTYVEPASGRVDEEDRRASEPLPDDLRRVVLLEGERSPQLDEFVVRWQQTTGPVMAKGVEDTAFYRYFRLTALNEVGGNPGRFSIGPDEFHAAALDRVERYPLAARVADARHEAGRRRARAHRRARRHVRALGGARAQLARADRRPRRPERGVPRLADARRCVADRAAAARAVSREGAARVASGTRTGSSPNERHEARVMSFVRSLYENQAFLDDFEPFAQDVAVAGEHASLGALLLRLTVAGAPRHLPGRRVLVAQPRRPRQPAPDRLGAALPRREGGARVARR